MISAMGTNIAGRDPGTLWWAAVIIGVDRDLQKEVTAEWRPQGDEGGGTRVSGEYITGRAAVPRLEILPHQRTRGNFWRYGDAVDSQYGEAGNAGDHPEMHPPTPHPHNKAN